MKLIELHILQSFPVSCLNRDDVGSPKSAVFGGAQRARISSQCLKRASRLLFNESHYGNAFHTERTRLAHETLASQMTEEGVPEDLAQRLSLEILSKLVDSKGASKAKEDKNGRTNLPALIWLSPAQFKAAAQATAAHKDTILETLEKARSGDKKAEKESEKAIKKALTPIISSIQKAGILDAPDIAFFGRMVANDPSLNIEAAAMCSHALSTHAASNEVDYYTAVDDAKQRHGLEEDSGTEDAGAGMIGSLEFNSATYYRYVAINLDLLAEPTHLGGLSEDERKDILRAFIQAALTAVPNARKNSMNASTLPHEVLGIRKSSGQPLQLINAFEKPVASRNGFKEASVDSMKAHLIKIEDIWGDQGSKHWLTEEGLENFLNNLLED